MRSLCIEFSHPPCPVSGNNNVFPLYREGIFHMGVLSSFRKWRDLRTQCSPCTYCFSSAFDSITLMPKWHVYLPGIVLNTWSETSLNPDSNLWEHFIQGKIDKSTIIEIDFKLFFFLLEETHKDLTEDIEDMNTH